MKNQTILAAVFSFLFLTTIANAARVKGNLDATDFLGMGPQNIVVKISAGEVLPLKVKIAGDVLDAAPVEISLYAQRDLYIKSDKNKLQLSWDGVNFSPFKQKLLGNFEISLNQAKIETQLDLVRKD